MAGTIQTFVSLSVLGLLPANIALHFRPMLYGFCIWVIFTKEENQQENGGELFISETTVKKHISNIFEKLEIDRREEMIKVGRGERQK